MAGNTPNPARPPRPCPICEKPATGAYLPFCSRRCADLDLGLWLKGAYRIPAVEPPDGFSDEDAEALARGAGEGRD
jgi:endogenous inhibitor of DNA gyrase (YacG/DUF329 family)